MHRIFLSFIALIATLTMAAFEVTDCTAGKLATQVSDCTISELRVTGHIDARDFRFISDSLRHLQVLDLQSAVIDAYEADGKPLFGSQFTYPAHEVPVMSLASMNQMMNVALPDSTTSMATGCLSGCNSLIQVNLPVALQQLGDYALSGCQSLTEVTAYPALSRVGDGAFSACPELIAVQIVGADSVVPAQALTIGKRAFANCPMLKFVRLGNRWSELGEEAFAETGLETIDLSKQTMLDRLAQWSLAQSQLQEVILPEALEVMGEGTLMRNANIKQLTLPATVRHIDSYAMAQMTGLEQLESLPDDVPTLGDSVWCGVDQPSVLLVVSKDSRNDYAAAQQWCNFLLPSALRGDVNNDGEVDIADVNALINVIVGIEDADKYEGRANVDDSDSVVDIGDLNALINIILARRLKLERLAAQQAAEKASATRGANTPVIAEPKVSALPANLR